MNKLTTLPPQAEPEPIVVNAVVMNAPLTAEERLEYQARIARILDNYQNIAQKSMEMWRDLQFIKDNRLYREKYDDFQSFCKDELGKDNSVIYRHLRDAKLKEELLLVAASDEERASISSLKESNTRYIRTLPEEVWVAVWKLCYGTGMAVGLPKKDDGSLELTTEYISSVVTKMDEIMEQGGLHLNGEFIDLNNAEAAAQVAGTDEDTVKMALFALGVTEDYYELLQRQKDHIKEKSTKADVVSVKGTVEVKLDKNGSEYAIMVDSSGNEIEINDLILSFNLRHINLSIKAPIRT